MTVTTASSATRRRSTAAALATALLVGGLAVTTVAGPAAAAPVHDRSAPGTDAGTTATGDLFASCQYGNVRGTWERSGTTFTAHITQYGLQPSDSAVGSYTGAIAVTLNGGTPTQRTDLLTDRNTHAIDLRATTQVPTGQAVEATFTIRASGFPSYPSCTVTKWY
ncbi:hypothetical protein E9228_001607 [Curtobacterium flaccumfaciens]|uniref:Glycosyl hydrolase family 98 putative carbohydrate-binding module domain-containing protein n=1 Tax=Curtobacterium salicis TaxID=1779862 RepID=A0ABX0T957_9MICO|nr:hypothetical protein [Curtobacterium sp. WW7]NII40971.1 hypothetical protein [Curtobacterium sp. WW7]